MQCPILYNTERVYLKKKNDAPDSRGAEKAAVAGHSKTGGLDVFSWRIMGNANRLA